MVDGKIDGNAGFFDASLFARGTFFWFQNFSRNLKPEFCVTENYIMILKINYCRTAFSLMGFNCGGSSKKHSTSEGLKYVHNNTLVSLIIMLESITGFMQMQSTLTNEALENSSGKKKKRKIFAGYLNAKYRAL